MKRVGKEEVWWCSLFPEKTETVKIEVKTHLGGFFQVVKVQCHDYLVLSQFLRTFHAV